MSFDLVNEFENKVAGYFGAPYGVAVDCCTHGLELALRYTEERRIKIPTHTYLSVPMLSNKLGIGRMFKEEEWEKYYYITPTIIDAAVLWEEKSYIPGTLMVLSFQFKKHLNLGRGGMILTDDTNIWYTLRKMTYDGRIPNSDKPWAEQDINSVGYHYYMTPETASKGLKILDSEEFKNKPVKEWSWRDYPNLMNFKVFSNG